MTVLDPFADPIRRPFDASYPASVLSGGGGGTPGGDITANVATATGVDPATLADLPALKADPTIGDGNYVGGAFAPSQYVVLGDSSAATWDGSVWTEFN